MKIKAIVATAFVLFSSLSFAQSPQQVCKDFAMSAMKVKWLFEVKPHTLPNMLQSADKVQEPLRTELRTLYNKIYLVRKESDESVYRSIYVECITKYY